MNNNLKSLSFLLALLAILLVFAGCENAPQTTDPASTPATQSHSSGENGVTPSSSGGNEEDPSSPESASSPSDDQSSITKETALQKMLTAYNATMSATSARLSGTVSNYTAGFGKGDTVIHPISFACTKDDGTFKAVLSYGGTVADTECYFEGIKKITKLTDKESGEVTVTTGDHTEEYSISSTVMPIFAEAWTITSHENVFRRFCDANYDVELKDGIYTFYFYGSYTELARIFLEDDDFESFKIRDVESQFTTSASLEIRITESGFFLGISSEISLESPDESMKSAISYNFADINGQITVERPNFSSEE